MVNSPSRHSKISHWNNWDYVPIYPAGSQHCHPQQLVSSVSLSVVTEVTMVTQYDYTTNKE